MFSGGFLSYEQTGGSTGYVMLRMLILFRSVKLTLPNIGAFYNSEKSFMGAVARQERAFRLFCFVPSDHRESQSL
jgi:hypothetical protein